MLGILAANCGRHNLLSRIVKQHALGCNTFMQANGNLARTFGWRLANRLARNRNIPSGRSNMKSHALLVGGSAVFLGLGARSLLWPREVHCDVNRLGTVWQKTLSPDEIKFDWRRLWFYLEPQKWELLFSIAAALIVALLNIRIPSLLGDLTNVLARYASAFISDPMAKGFLSDVRKPATNLLSLFFLQSMFTFAYIYMLSRIGERMAARIRQDLFKQIIIQDIEFFDANRTGELVNRLTIDVQDFKSSFKQFVSQGLRSATQMIGGAISLIFISPHMAIIALASVPAVVTFMSYLAKRLRTLSKASQEQSERATSVCEETVSNIRTVRASACEYREVQLFTTETNEAAKTAQQLGYGIAVFQGLTNFFLNSLVLTTLYMGGHLMYKECLSAGQLMAFLVASQGLQRSLSQASMLIGTMLRGLMAGTRVFEFLQIKPKVDLLQGYVVPEDRLLGEIRFENVSFAYPARPDHLVLDNFNLTIQPGETVALVGASGSGKSTIAALLERFYEPSCGVIKLDGYRLCDISPQWLRTNVLGFIEQQPVLFATTILENIRYGRPNAAKEEVYAASEQSQAHEFVTKLPNGYETYVGERGAQISGGQRQRIAIARALLKNPKVLILDEATSALDATSEAEVQRALDSAVKERTTLVIAHRLSTIRNADLIVVIDDGKIVESGKHKDLMAKGGHYYRLVRQQEKRQPAEGDQQKNKQGINVSDENAKRVNSVQG